MKKPPFDVNYTYDQDQLVKTKMSEPNTWVNPLTTANVDLHDAFVLDPSKIKEYYNSDDEFKEYFTPTLYANSSQGTEATLKDIGDPDSFESASYGDCSEESNQSESVALLALCSAEVEEKIHQDAQKSTLKTPYPA